MQTSLSDQKAIRTCKEITEQKQSEALPSAHSHSKDLFFFILHTTVERIRSSVIIISQKKTISHRYEIRCDYQQWGFLEKILESFLLICNL